MNDHSQPLILDGHNDLLLQLYRTGKPDAADLYFEGREGHIDHGKVIKGGFGGGFFAVYVPSPADLEGKFAEMCKPEYRLPLPDPVPYAQALPVAVSQIAHLKQLETRGALQICTSVAQIQSTLSTGKMAAILHMEGAEAIDRDLAALDVFYAAGLRSLGPVWSRNTIWGNGVPFAFPSTPDIGPGLTPDGLRLVKACNQKRIMIDLSHLNEAGFWDVAKHSHAPLVATHSNVHALCPSARNLTDKQLAAIAETNGMVGLNYAVAFLRSDGNMQADCGLETMLQHLDYMIDMLGENRVGLGSDFDGAIIPSEIKTAAGNTNLRAAMRAHGYGEELIKKLCHENWLRVLKVTWGA